MIKIDNELVITNISGYNRSAREKFTIDKIRCRLHREMAPVYTMNNSFGEKEPAAFVRGKTSIAGIIEGDIPNCCPYSIGSPITGIDQNGNKIELHNIHPMMLTSNEDGKNIWRFIAEAITIKESAHKTKPTVTKCTCGATKCKLPKHSDWCDINDRKRS